MIRVLLVDDDPVCRDGLRQILSLAGDIAVVGEAAGAQEAIGVVSRFRPDVVVIDAELPHSSCMEAMKELLDSGRIAEVPSFICLAVYPDQHDAAVLAGATRFLRKDCSRTDLVEAIRAAALKGGGQTKASCEPGTILASDPATSPSEDSPSMGI